MYERLKRVFRTEEKKGLMVKRGYKEKLGEALGAGFFAKLIATVVTYPHEVFSFGSLLCPFYGLEVSSAVWKKFFIGGKTC